MDAWLILGFAAQGLFFMRFVVQWIATERAGQSVFPVSFWYYSLFGSALLLVYSIYRKDPVFIAGQGLAMFIYLRNLYFIRKGKNRVPETSDAPVE